MARVRFLQFSDLHLGAPFASLGDRAAQRQHDLLAAFKRIVDFGLSETAAVDAVLIPGDIFNTYNPKPSLVGEVQAQLKRFAEANKPVVVIPGTHDAYGYKESVYKKFSFEGVQIFTSPMPGEPFHLFLKGNDVFFYGFAYDPVNSRDPLGALKVINADGLHIALLHGSISDRTDIEIRKKDLPLTTVQLEALGFSYVALGHYHNRREFRRADGRLLGAYAGSPEATKVTETGPRHALVVTLGEGVGTLETFCSNVRTAECFDVDITGLQSDNDVAEAMAAKLQRDDLWVRFALTGTPEFIPSLDYLRSVVSPRCFHLEIEDRSNFADSIFISRVENETATIRKIYVDLLREKMRGKDAEERQKLELALKIGMSEFMRHSR